MNCALRNHNQDFNFLGSVKDSFDIKSICYVLLGSFGVIESGAIPVNNSIRIDPFVGYAGFGQATFSYFDVAQRHGSFKRETFEELSFFCDKEIFGNKMKQGAFALSSISYDDDSKNGVDNMIDASLDLSLDEFEGFDGIILQG